MKGCVEYILSSGKERWEGSDDQWNSILEEVSDMASTLFELVNGLTSLGGILLLDNRRQKTIGLNTIGRP